MQNNAALLTKFLFVENSYLHKNLLLMLTCNGFIVIIISKLTNQIFFKSVLIPNAVNIKNNNPHKDVICCPQLFLSVKTKKVKNHSSKSTGEY